MNFSLVLSYTVCIFEYDVESEKGLKRLAKGFAVNKKF